MGAERVVGGGVTGVQPGAYTGETQNSSSKGKTRWGFRGASSFSPSGTKIPRSLKHVIANPFKKIGQFSNIRSSKTTVSIKESAQAPRTKKPGKAFIKSQVVKLQA